MERPSLAGLARALLLGQAALLCVLVAGTRGWIVTLPHLVSTDYVSFHAAGALARAGRAALAYDPAAHAAAEAAVAAPGGDYQFFFYPPVYLLLCAPLSLLPCAAGLAAFEASTLLAWLLAARRVLGRVPGFLPVLLAIPSGFWTIGLGQNAFLSAALMAAGTSLIERRPALAGVAFGLLAYKPHLGLLVPVALIAGRHWRALGAATATVLALAGLSLALFGPACWMAFLHQAAGTATVFESGRIRFAGQVSIQGACLLLGWPVGVARAAQAAASAGAALAVALAWRRGGVESRGAALAAGAVVAAPVLLFYDLMTAAVAGLWIARAGLREGFRPGERGLLVALTVADLFAYPVAAAWRVPLGAVIAPALLARAVRRMRRR